MTEILLNRYQVIIAGDSINPGYCAGDFLTEAQAIIHADKNFSDLKYFIWDGREGVEVSNHTKTENYEKSSAIIGTVD